MTAAFSRRRQALQRLLAAKKIDTLVVTQPANWFYLSGFTGESGALLVGRSGTTLITDGRFTVQAAQETSRVRTVQQKGSLQESVGQFLKESRIRTVGFDPVHTSYAQWKALRRAAGKRVRWTPVSGLVESLRQKKEPEEVAQMRKAAILAGEVVQKALRYLKPGVRESEVAAEIEYLMRKGGAIGPAFQTIVAFGERAALPHARPTAKRLRKNELVVLDLGVILGHYCSDITRTVFCGKAPARIRGWYKAVQEAQEAATEAVGDGAACGDVDAAARRVLAGYQLDRYFVHSTGHGLGLEVHEDPRVARGQKQRLEAGNVITIEPGVYVPEVGGIRIEDDVAVLAQGREVLTRVPRDLIEL